MKPSASSLAAASSGAATVASSVGPGSTSSRPSGPTSTTSTAISAGAGASPDAFAAGFRSPLFAAPAPALVGVAFSDLALAEAARFDGAVFDGAGFTGAAFAEGFLASDTAALDFAAAFFAAGLAARGSASTVAATRRAAAAAATRLRGATSPRSTGTPSDSRCSATARLSFIGRSAAAQARRTSAAVTEPDDRPRATRSCTSGSSTIRACLGRDELDDTNNLSTYLAMGAAGGTTTGNTTF